MLHNPFALPTPATRILYPAAATFLLALAGLTLAAALPNPWSLRQDPGVTSGGKFAARVPGLDTTVSNDATPATVVAGVARLPVLLHPAEVAVVGWLSGMVDSSAETDWTPAPIVKADRPRRRPDVHRVASTVTASPRSPVAMADTGMPTSDEGLMPKLLSSARSLWSETASAGGSLVSRVWPQ